MDRLPDLSISGMGKVNGGTFSHVEISGMGKVFNDLEAERINVSGKGNIEGNTKVHTKMDVSGMATIAGNFAGGDLTISGSGTIEGNLEAKSVEVSGNLKIKGAAQITELSTDGRTRIEKGLKGERINTRGYLSVGGDLEAEGFYDKGSFAIDGLLNANHIEIEIHGFCRAKEIGGEEITVRNYHLTLPIVSKIVNPFLGEGKELDTLTSDLIEGTNLSLEHTHAKIVRGNNVKIGQGCVIDEVEYTHNIEIDPNAVVHKQTKIL